MMKKYLAALLALMLCTAAFGGAFAEAAPAVAEDDWYMETALYVTEQMNALADNEAYVELFIGMGEDTDGFADQMAQLKGLTPDEVITYRYKTDALESLAAAYQMDEVTTALSKPAMESIYRRMNQALGSMLNSHVGGTLWLAVASALNYTETFLMPDDFAPCSLLLRYEGQEAAVLVSFSQTGTETITVSATYVRADVAEDEVAQTYLDLMWECTSAPLS